MHLLPGWAAIAALSVVTSASLFLGTPSAAQGTAADPLAMIELDEVAAGREGLRRQTIDLGAGELNFTAYLASGAEIDVLATAADIVTPGYQPLVEIRDPGDPEGLLVTAIAFSPGFAAAARPLSEQLLLGYGYDVAASEEQNVLRAQSHGYGRHEGTERAARSLCAIRGGTHLCLLMEYDRRRELEAARHAAVLAGSLAFEGDRPDDFGESDLVAENLPLADGSTLALLRPGGWTVSVREFEEGREGHFVIHLGEEGNDASAMSFTASQGEAPQTAEGMRVVADSVVERYVDANDDLLSTPRWLREERRTFEGDAVDHLTYVYLADGLKTEATFQLRVTLLVEGSMRFATVAMSNYSRDPSDLGAFYPRWAALMAEDLVVRSVINHGRSER